MIIGDQYGQNPFEKGTLFLFCGKRSDFSTPVEIGTGHITTITATVDVVDPITHTLRLYTGVVNEFGKELPVVIGFDEILEVCTLQISTTHPSYTPAT